MHPAISEEARIINLFYRKNNYKNHSSMARIKKKGLDYFPLNTDFIHDRAVRRLMKRGGDSALGILVEVLSYIYAGEGYYVRADRLFYEDLSAGLYENSADDVERIIRLAVEYGLFDAGLFERERILTSAEIQRQYLFSTRRRNVPGLEAAYSLLTVEESVENKEDRDKNTLSCCANQGDGEDVSAVEYVTFIPENVTSGTHSIAQHSIAQQSKKDPLLSPPLRKTGEEGKRKRGKEEVFSETSCGRDAARHSVGLSAGSSASSVVNALATSSSGEDSVRHSVAPPVGSSASFGSAVANGLVASSSARDAVRYSAVPSAGSSASFGSAATNGLAASSFEEDSVPHSVASPVASSASSGSAGVNALAASSFEEDSVRHSAAPPAAPSASSGSAGVNGLAANSSTRDAVRYSAAPPVASSASAAANGLAASSSARDAVRYSAAPPAAPSASSGSAGVNGLTASYSREDAVRYSAVPSAAGGLFANPCGGGESQSPAACVKGDSGSGKRKIWTQEAIDGLLPPADGTPRNYAGLLDNLRIYGIPPAEQYAIIRKSNFGAIGGSIWKGIAALRGSGGKIKLPGRYLLSVVNRRDDEAAS
ncbi:hypothetical protein JCM6294_2128 [Bacteroides pyogenes DSM 20611 = JCM 6294]|uniref:Lin1244/Lin1753-like N-terminal domain-containing protein n=1 Tax=Bacteroides pyogenes DSM 20611 = JCM 6294 TaxID=1121100 RepID=W4PIZ7_9BACE|nr:hypothetical protein JCM6294_2128 [Bacteroides pyogenes DSM 20611 = JCM 6294]